jgi:hypothetical protein
MMEKMKDNSEPEEDRAVGTDYSAEEAEQMAHLSKTRSLSKTLVRA